MMTDILTQLRSDLGGTIPQLLAALAILVVGWIVAALVAKGVRGGLRRTGLDERIAGLTSQDGKGVETGRWISQVVFYLLMLIVVIGVLQTLNLTLVTTPFNSLLTEVFAFLPKLVAAAILFALAWGAATILRRIVAGTLTAAKVDERIGGEAGEDVKPTVATSIAETVYWFVFLLFLPAILGALELRGLLGPVQNMFDVILGFLPNLLAAATIGLVGWFVARVVRRIVTSLLSAAGVDRIGERIGLPDRPARPSVSEILGLVSYVLILVPVLISSLNALNLSAVTEPATRMLAITFDAIPLIVGATLVLLLAYVVGKVLAGLATNLLKAAGFDSVLVSMGLADESSAAVTSADRSPSVVAGRLVLAAVMIFALIEAAGILGFEMLADLTGQFLVLASQILFGLVIFAVGFWLARLASNAVAASGVAQAGFLSRVTWGAIVLFSAAVGLRRMGLADDIINLAFGLLLGAVAVAAAIAFGVGGREVAAQQVRRWTGAMGSAPAPRMSDRVE